MICNKFESCSAPICPLEADFELRPYLNGEPVCFYMSEYVKPNSESTLIATIGIEATKAVSSALLSHKCSHGAIYRRLKRASTTPSRLRKRVSNDSITSSALQKNRSLEPDTGIELSKNTEKHESAGDACG